jgi:hypothetical protein
MLYLRYKQYIFTVLVARDSQKGRRIAMDIELLIKTIQSLKNVLLTDDLDYIYCIIMDIANGKGSC